MYNHYRKFVPRDTKIARLLNQRLKKGQPFNMTGFDQQGKKVFHTLKDFILTPLVFALQKKDLEYFLDTNVIDYQIGAAIFQTYPDKPRKPDRFFSIKLAETEKNYSASEKNFLQSFGLSEH